MNSVNLLFVLKRLQENDETALSQLYKLYNKKLLLFAKSIVRTKELSEEVVENVFIKLWSNRAAALQINNLNVYLYTAVKNSSLNMLAKKSNQLHVSSFDFLNMDIETGLDSPYELIVTSDMMRSMQHAVEALPPRCKLIFRLVREDGLKYKEVAEILNISINTIDVQMAIAIKKICRALQIEKPEKPFLFASEK